MVQLPPNEIQVLRPLTILRFGYIALDCPNRSVVALVAEYDDDDGIEAMEELEVDKVEEEVTYANQGISTIVQCNLKASHMVEDENWLKQSIFHTRCTSHGKVCLVIIDIDTFENVISQEMVQELLDTILHLNPYQLWWLQKQNEIKVTKTCLVPFFLYWQEL